MDIILQILYTVLVLGLLIFIHELGHFIAAKAFKIKVNEFALGMGPAILKKQGKETLYSLRLFPIGGFCQLEGEDSDTPVQEIPEGSMQSKPVWQRMIVVTAGALMNLILGILITAILVVAQPIPSLTVGEFAENAETARSGLQIGDKIIAIDGKKVGSYTDFVTELSRAYNRNTIPLTVLREGAEKELIVTFPTQAIDEDLSCPVLDFRVYREEKNVLTVLKYTVKNSCAYVTMMYESLADMITGRVSLKYVSGPIGMSGMISDAVSNGWTSIASLIALISINLAVMNMLPLPALDGGRFLFMLIELIRGKPVSVKYEAAIHAIGFVLLMLLTLVIAFKDIFFPVG